MKLGPARYVDSLLSKLNGAHLLSHENAWVFVNEDETLTNAVRQAVSDVASAWLHAQSPSTLSELFFDHTSLDEVLPSVLINHCIGFLGPRASSPVSVPIKKSDALRNVLTVSTTWNKMAHNIRYKNLCNSGIMFDAAYRNFELSRHERASSFARFWCRRKPKTLKVSTVFVGVAVTTFLTPPQKSSLPRV